MEASLSTNVKTVLTTGLPWSGDNTPLRPLNSLSLERKRILTSSYTFLVLGRDKLVLLVGIVAQVNAQLLRNLKQLVCVLDHESDRLAEQLMVGLEHLW